LTSSNENGSIGARSSRSLLTARAVFDRIRVGEPPIRDVERLRALATA